MTARNPRVSRRSASSVDAAAARASVDAIPAMRAALAATVPDATPVDATPDRHARVRIGGPSAPMPTIVAASPFTLNGAMLNGTPNPRPADACTVAPVALTAADAPALVALAAMLLRSAGALNLGDGPTIPLDSTHDAVRFYLSNRATATTPTAYFARNRISPTDEMMYLTRAAERLVYAADRLTSRTARRAFCGGYGSANATADRRDSLALTVASLSNP